MEIRILKKNGVPPSEVQAFQTIQKDFNRFPFTKSWRGYASFSIARKGPGAGDDDFDMALVTHTNIAVCELKNWVGRKLTSQGGQWFVDGKLMEHTSPVAKTRLNAKKLASLIKQKLGVEKAAFVSSYVILTGKIDEIDLPEDEASSVLTLQEFLSIKTPDNYRKYFQNSRTNPLDHLADYDEFFEGSSFKPKEYFINGFSAGDTPIFVHPKNLYKEYKATAKDDEKALALMRQWDFSAIGMALIGEKDRAPVGLREQRVYDYVAATNAELSLSLLRPAARKEASDVLMDYSEVFHVPGKVARLTEFTNSVLPKLTPDERVPLVKALLNRFAELHDLQVVHRDLGDHAIWLARPSKVVISGTTTAQYPGATPFENELPLIRANDMSAPEEAEGASQVGATHFRHDVYMLGNLAYLILHGVKPKQSTGLEHTVLLSSSAYPAGVEDVLQRAMADNPKARHTNARTLLEDFNQATASASTSIIDISTFDAFKAATKERDYDETEVFADTSSFSSFRSEEDGVSRHVQVWFGIEPDPEKPDFSLRLLSFLERTRILKSSAFDALPPIVDFGLTKRSLLLVEEWTTGMPLTDWLAKAPSLERRLALALSLTDIATRMHALDLAHGAISLENIYVREGDKLLLKEGLSFTASAPESQLEQAGTKARTLTPYEKDRYDVASVLMTVFGVSHADPGQRPFPISRVYVELSNIMSAVTLSTLVPLVAALHKAVTGDVSAPGYKVAVPSSAVEGSVLGTMRADNGNFHVQIQNDARNVDGVRIYISGIGRLISMSWNMIRQELTFLRVTNLTQSQFVKNQMLKDASIEMDIALVPGPVPDATELVKFILTNHEVQARISKLNVNSDFKRLKEARVDKLNAAARALKEAFTPKEYVPVAELWQTLIDAEEETFFTASIAGDRRRSPTVRGQILVPYHSDEAFDFTEADEVLVEMLNTDGIWMNCGRLNLRDTTVGDDAELAIDNPPAQAVFNIGVTLRLVSALNKASFLRRKYAVERIVQNKAAIPNLIQYLDPIENRDMPPQVYPTPTDEDLAIYAKSDGALDPSQQAAFKRALTYGPISLLQGPPGTGKTWFIATLLHHLMSKQGARRILLVSQAHEAVNNALEKGLELCRKLGVDFNAVRLGNEAAASDAVKHLHTSTLEMTYRERFRAERKERITRVAKVIGLSAAFVGDYVELDQTLGHLSNQLVKLEQRGEDTDLEARAAADTRKKTLEGAFVQIAEYLYEHRGFSVDNHVQVVRDLRARIIAKHSVRSEYAIERLDKILALSDEWVGALGSSDANFAEFLAKSRTVVAGTLVGIGYRGAGVVQNIFDWVIIDEAGRAAPSELAVALQAGHRVLLVGDHQQLPPTFTEPVKAAVKEHYGVGDEDALFHSDFQRIFDSTYGQTVGSTLSNQYRMAPAIGELVSSVFYKSGLETARGAVQDYYKYLPRELSKEVTWIDTSALGPKGLEQDYDHGANKANPTEARVVMNLLRKIIESEEFLTAIEKDLEPQEPPIGIICMYSKQRELIDKLKSEAGWLQGFRRLVKVDTVDSYQGKENHIVILSTVRNNPHGNPGFLRSPNRINVAMSRAMDRLYIVGAQDMWTGDNKNLPLGLVLAKVQELEQKNKADIQPATQFMGY